MFVRLCQERCSRSLSSSTWTQPRPKNCDIIIQCVEDWADSHGGQKKCLQHVLLPHEIAAGFLENNLKHRMTGYGSLCDFWEPESSTTWFRAHPVLSETRLQRNISMLIYFNSSSNIFPS